MSKDNKPEQGNALSALLDNSKANETKPAEQSASPAAVPAVSEQAAIQSPSAPLRIKAVYGRDSDTVIETTESGPVEMKRPRKFKDFVVSQVGKATGKTKDILPAGGVIVEGALDETDAKRIVYEHFKVEQPSICTLKVLAA